MFINALKKFANNNLIPYISTYLVPIIALIYYFFKSTRAYFIPQFIAIYIVGVTDSLTKYKTWTKPLSAIIGHSPLLIFPLIWKPTPVPYLLLGVGILYIIGVSVLIGIPIWHYRLTRKQFIKIYTGALLLVLLILPHFPEYYPI